MNKILAIIMVLTLFLYGCASDAPENNSNNGNSAEEISGISLLNEITATMENGLNAEYSVTYEMDYGEEKADITLYMKDGKIRTDAIAQGIESRSYFTGNAATICTKQNDKFSCLKVTSDEETYNPADINLSFTEYEEEIASENEQFKIYRDGTITVSGNVAKCYAFEYGTAVKERTCLSKEGILLYHKYTEGTETSEFTAKSYSTKVSDSVFELPAGAEIIDMNDQIASMQSQYGGDSESMNELAECYSDCESSGGSDEEKQECYMSC
ncbi:MAG TPA: hypothetical protein VEC16_00695 [Alphaproteobacteria bacterium]|nr:hypothetical protein [Alphaproteobacteria bacterium]